MHSSSKSSRLPSKYTPNLTYLHLGSPGKDTLTSCLVYPTNFQKSLHSSSWLPITPSCLLTDVPPPHGGKHKASQKCVNPKRKLVNMAFWPHLLLLCPSLFFSDTDLHGLFLKTSTFSHFRAFFGTCVPLCLPQTCIHEFQALSFCTFQISQLLYTLFLS